MAVPYQFEPEIASGEEDNTQDESMSEESEQEELANEERRQGIDKWCTCQQCVVMETADMCLCCNELESRKYDNTQDSTCITTSEGFQCVCLNRDVLWTALVSLHDREGSSLPTRTNIPNNSLRYASYRQFTWWVHGYLGKKIRRVIPACVVSKIRSTFPNPNEEYTGFKEDGSEVAEVNLAWEF
ncbi:P2X purinoceptor 7-like [Actinia tenebrosa]|uniref:P2X purinoceptor 7-like n=1 Tax=Actinia tenebrosa TaxID=6105 RepID=A0A6P8I9E5_ACTTE|nr:P2X purinoceptor 7-like [Actinia tenebrosa]